MTTLYYSPTSPYARKVRVLLRELGLHEQIAEVALAPLDDPAALLAANPLSKVPALALDDGSALYDSRVICAWLLAQHSAAPATADDRAHWQLQRRAALAEGIIDAAVAMTMEYRRPQPQQSDYWLQRWTHAIERSVAVLDAEVATLANAIDAVTAGAALAYLDFRQPQIAWRAQAPALARWLDAFAQRPAMQATIPG